MRLLTLFFIINLGWWCSATDTTNTNEAATDTSDTRKEEAGAAVKKEADTMADRINFVEALRKGDSEGIRQALQNNPNMINRKGPDDQTPLIQATLNGWTKAAKALLENGADMTIWEHDGFSVMHVAAQYGRSNILKMLLKRGDNPMQAHPDGFYPFHRACYGAEDDHTDTVEVFLDNGMDIDIKSRKGKTCLELAQKKNHGTIHLLMHRGATPPDKKEL